VAVSDDVDVSNDRWEWFVSMKIREKNAAKPEAEYTGECLYCDTPVPEGHRWCDAECRDTWQKLNKEK
jgi:hypothetical protein